MSRAQTNDSKRAVMASVVNAAIAKGWTVAQLASLYWVTPGCVNSWRRGSSMGTNAQRAGIAALASPAEEWNARLRDVVVQLRREVEKAEKRADASHAAGALLVEKQERVRIASIRARIAAMETIGADSAPAVAVSP